MAEYTNNLHLIKPTQSENYDVDVANTNNEIIDTAIGSKVSKVAGKGLSSNDFTTEYKRKIDGLQKIYKYKGSVTNYSDLANITDKSNGDVWNVTSQNKDYAWNENEWTLLGTNTDLSDYVTDEELDDIVNPITEEQGQMSEDITDIQSDISNIQDDIEEINDEIAINKSTVTTSAAILENTDYTIPLNYKVGADVLDIYYMGEKLVKGTHYIEVGNTDSISNKIQFYNWGQSVPTGRTIEFIVRGVYS